MLTTTRESRSFCCLCFTDGETKVPDVNSLAHHLMGSNLGGLTLGPSDSRAHSHTSELDPGSPSKEPAVSCPRVAQGRAWGGSLCLGGQPGPSLYLSKVGWAGEAGRCWDCSLCHERSLWAGHTLSERGASSKAGTLSCLVFPKQEQRWVRQLATGWDHDLGLGFGVWPVIRVDITYS